MGHNSGTVVAKTAGDRSVEKLALGTVVVHDHTFAFLLGTVEAGLGLRQITKRYVKINYLSYIFCATMYTYYKRTPVVPQLCSKSSSRMHELLN